MLFVQESTLPGSGKGLFTDTAFKKGDKICEYEGEYVTWKECQRRCDEGELHRASYFFYINSQNCIDAYPQFDSLARYANDAKGFSRIKGINNNAEYQIIKKVPYIVATKSIPAGSEIFVSYGKEYWDAMKELVKDEPETTEQKHLNGKNGHALNGHAKNGHSKNGHDLNGHTKNGNAKNGKHLNGSAKTKKPAAVSK